MQLGLCQKRGGLLFMPPCRST